MSNKTILIWEFENAPTEYKLLSDNGGDENYIAFIPEGFTDQMIHGYVDMEETIKGPEYPYIPFIEDNNFFGSCSIDHYKVNGGWIFIGAH